METFFYIKNNFPAGKEREKTFQIFVHKNATFLENILSENLNTEIDVTRQNSENCKSLPYLLFEILTEKQKRHLNERRNPHCPS